MEKHTDRTFEKHKGKARTPENQPNQNLRGKNTQKRHNQPRTKRNTRRTRRRETSENTGKRIGKK